MKKLLSILLVLSLILCMFGCGAEKKGAKSEEPDPTDSPEAEEPIEISPAEFVSFEPTPTPAPPENQSSVEEARMLLDAGSYYESACKINEYMTAYPEGSRISECESMLYKIKDAVADLEPESGTELERHFQYQGGSTLTVLCFTGAAVITVTDINDPDQFVRFYCRAYETATISLLAGSYSVAYSVGDIWFGDEIGFGELGTDVECEDTLECKYSSGGGWITNSAWTLTI